MVFSLCFLVDLMHNNIFHIFSFFLFFFSFFLFFKILGSWSSFKGRRGETKNRRKKKSLDILQTSKGETMKQQKKKMMIHSGRAWVIRLSANVYRTTWNPYRCDPSSSFFCFI